MSAARPDTRGAGRRPGGINEDIRRRHSWLELLQTSGPFLTLPVVHRVFPNGLPVVPASDRAQLRLAIEEVLENAGADRRRLVTTVLHDVLDWQHRLVEGNAIPDSLAEPIQEHGLTVRADFAFFVENDEDGAAADPDGDPNSADDEDEEDSSAEETEAQGPWRLFGMLSPWGLHPLTRTAQGGWTASAVERLAVLLRARDVPIGLTTDGRWWALVWAPRGGTTGCAVWDASLWSTEPDTLRAFVALLQRSRFLAVAQADTLPALLQESLLRQEEVTETLGRQVRDAVEMLVGTIDRLDADGGRTLLADVDDDEFYAGVVTVMMRVIFLLFAEERRLLPSDDALYVSAYSVSRLVDQLESQASLLGEQALEHRTGAWHRLLAVARAVHQGVAHEDLRMPAYGGSMFHPDRFPWLEGRRDTVTDPGSRVPAVDDRTVLRMLRAVQYVEAGGERRRLSFRALDVEQIGYVYEGLLELEVRTAEDVTLGMIRPPKWPRATKVDSEVALTDATRILAGLDRGPSLAEWASARTGWTKARLVTALAAPGEQERRQAVLRAVGGDLELAEAINPFAAVLRYDERGLPAVTLPGGRFVAPSTRRAASGTHYTPRSLAEDVAGNTLEPLVYRPGPLETADRSTWQLRPSSAILELKVADIAMGSGAFLTAACRYLADRLVEAWETEGRRDALEAVRRRAGHKLSSDAEIEQVQVEARRLIAEHCLYGVDINPLAVEMAKLSLWLVTMDRERPFGFLDDRLKAGDSLLGLGSTDQLEALHVDPVAGRKLHQGMVLDLTAGVRPLLQRAADLRRRITAAPVVTIRDVEHKVRLLAEAEENSSQLRLVADAVTATGLLAAAARSKEVDKRFLQLSWALSQDRDQEALAKTVAADLQAGRPEATSPREPLHWPLAFPEVFADTPTPGFDAVIGNPPFLGGQKITGSMGKEYLAWLQRWDGGGTKGSADLAARFVLRAQRLLAARGQLGYITTNTLVQGDTLEVGLTQATERGMTLRRGQRSHPWPSSSANLEIVNIWGSQAPLSGTSLPWLDGEEVPAIGGDLEPVGRVSGRPRRLAENDRRAFIGSYVLGLGFTLEIRQADELIRQDPRNAEVLAPFVIGKDLNQRPDCSASRWVINFRDWPLERAEQYPDAIDIVHRLVKPERDRNKRAARRERWWIFAERAPELYEEIRKRHHVLALSRHSNAVLPVRVETDMVFSDATVVFALEDFASLAFLSSSAHTIWAIRYGSTIRRDVRYTPSDVFLTLPRPDSTPEMERLGQRLDAERRELMLGRGWGLTTTYNHVHDPDDRDPQVQALRELHAEIDAAVLAAYGWSDLDLGIGHHPTKIGMRWTVSKEARFDLLDLLLEENHRRAALEGGA
ncbi:BREX-1 system adenine-specific DNA-methyltransferase PglX [Streptomyces sp. NBC_01142]|uniref:Eco57I restriction-modification methylase domain-containing protein n=1 Tax=Streptomyces sp. NBC_01142 TaxID=2975865 RepID=UPI00224CA152|nr:type IIL restriction-modification enzyme MmeI [Streptomyces sp. NBC_01142]MCX4826847.1 BREX-1 system adenine-specific DNA-methyltransferase PglX [Streptomyces sp. NBC_01142]